MQFESRKGRLQKYAYSMLLEPTDSQLWGTIPTFGGKIILQYGYISQYLHIFGNDPYQNCDKYILNRDRIF